MKKIFSIILALTLAASVFALGAAAEELTVYKTVQDWTGHTNDPKDTSAPDGFFHGFEAGLKTTAEVTVEDDETFVKFTFTSSKGLGDPSSQYIHAVYPAESHQMLQKDLANYNCIRFRVKVGENGLGFCPRFDFVNDKNQVAFSALFNNMLLQSKDGEILWDDTEYLNSYQIYLPGEFDGYVLCILDDENLIGCEMANWADTRYTFYHMPFYIIAADEGEFNDDVFYFGNVEACVFNDEDNPTPTATPEPTATPAPATEAPTATPAPATDAPTEAPTATPAPATDAPTEAPTATPAPTAQGSNLTWLYIVIGVVVVAAVVAAVLLGKKKKA